MGGTIIEDRGDVPALLTRALSDQGIDSTRAEIDKWRGASKREIIRHFVDLQSLSTAVDRNKITAAAYNQFTTELVKAYRSVPPVVGAEDAIRELRKRGYLLATTTGFDRIVTDSILTRLSWKPYFAATISSDDVTQGRPAPFMIFHAMERAGVLNVAEVMAVGDTPLDLQAGSNAGLPAVVGVLTGAATIDRLRAEPHTHIIESVAKLPSLLN